MVQVEKRSADGVGRAVFYVNSSRLTALRGAPQTAAEKKATKQGAPAKATPVVDAAPAWTKRVHKNPTTGEETPAAAATIDKQWSAQLGSDTSTRVAVAKH